MISYKDLLSFGNISTSSKLVQLCFKISQILLQGTSESDVFHLKNFNKLTDALGLKPLSR